MMSEIESNFLRLQFNSQHHCPIEDECCSPQLIKDSLRGQFEPIRDVLPCTLGCSVIHDCRDDFACRFVRFSQARESESSA